MLSVAASSSQNEGPEMPRNEMTSAATAGISGTVNLPVKRRRTEVKRRRSMTAAGSEAAVAAPAEPPVIRFSIGA
ncbi:hypothetical protein GCM10010411_70200 [Actinomadura fulvescens]|uniref:Uncharacterized protein n=1 Tax=Actinomadura fulvescens TaxID=46160 RepID=A0ABP6CNH0_9ACTN